MAELQSNVAAALTDFIVSENTVSREVKSDPKDRILLEIGDSKQPDFKPQVKIQRWDNDANFSIRAAEHPDSTVVVEGDIVKYITPDYEVHHYEKPDASADGGFEHSVLLLRRPESNVVVFTIQTKNLVFEYQGPLSLQEVEHGLFRPGWAIGSYAVFHATRGGHNDAAGPDYKAGKFGHIPCPIATDARGVQTRCDLNIDTKLGLLTVTVPQDYLDTAAYPVEVDPEFGYHTQGATSSWSLNGFINMGRAQISENGVGVSVSIFTNVSFGSTSGKFNIYQDETGGSDVNVALLTNGATVENTAMPTGPQWVTQNFVTPPTFVSGSFYRPAGWTNNVTAAYSDSAAGEHLYYRNVSYGAWADPSGTLTDNAHRMSAFVTYTSTATFLAALKLRNVQALRRASLY